MPPRQNRPEKRGAGSLPAGGAKEGGRAESSTGRAAHPPAAGRLAQTRSLFIALAGAQ
nr:MAG TPA: hypothetical protein [Caudoviricetes sp.]